MPVLLLRQLNPYMGISSLRSIIRSRETGVLGENATWEPISHHFKWEQILCDSVNPKPPVS